jgi:hypothetical protein
MARYDLELREIHGDFIKVNGAAKIHAHMAQKID